MKFRFLLCVVFLMNGAFALLNTAVALSGAPALMAQAFAKAIEAGRMARLADPMEPRDMAAPSTPVIGRAFTAA